MAKRRRDLDLELEPRRFPSFLTAAVRSEIAEIAHEPALEDRWKPGRQGTGYEKLDLREALDAGALDTHRGLLDVLLSQTRVSMGVEVSEWDAYLLRYRDGAYVPEHTDPVADRPHIRLNALITAATDGTGQLRLRGDVFDLAEGDAILFRPDVIDHRVSKVVGERLVFSVGCVFESGS